MGPHFGHAPVEGRGNGVSSTSSLAVKEVTSPDTAGRYYPSVRVFGHRMADTETPFARLHNLARVCVEEVS
jgi:hypothetical protein